MTSHSATVHKTVSPLLMVGIAVLPFIFVWPVLFGPYSPRAKNIAVIYFMLTVLAEVLPVLLTLVLLGGALG